MNECIATASDEIEKQPEAKIKREKTDVKQGATYIVLLETSKIREGIYTSEEEADEVRK